MPDRDWPDAYIVGAPKCATTSLYHYLQEHPDIDCPLRKESHFLLHEAFGVPDRYMPLEEARRLVRRSRAAVVLDVGVMTLYHEVARDRLRRLRPDAKIIILVRDPVDLIESLHSQAIKGGHELEPDLLAALRGDGRRRIETQPDRPGLVTYRTAAALRGPVEAWQAAFADVLVLHFDDLAAGLQDTLDRVTDFLGVGRFTLRNTRVYNPDARIRSRRLHDFLTAPPAWLKRSFHALVSQRVRDAVGGRLDAANRRRHERDEVDATLRARLEREFADDAAFVARFRGTGP
jgi:hypothetical protein